MLGNRDTFSKFHPVENSVAEAPAVFLFTALTPCQIEKMTLQLSVFLYPPKIFSNGLCIWKSSSCWTLAGYCSASKGTYSPRKLALSDCKGLEKGNGNGVEDGRGESWPSFCTENEEE